MTIALYLFVCRKNLYQFYLFIYSFAEIIYSFICRENYLHMYQFIYLFAERFLNLFIYLQREERRRVGILYEQKIQPTRNKITKQNEQFE